MRDRRSHPLRRIVRRVREKSRGALMEILTCGHAQGARYSYRSVLPAKSRRCWRCDEQRQEAAA